MGGEISVNPGDMKNYWTEAREQADGWQEALNYVSAALTAFRDGDKPEDFQGISLAEQENIETLLGETISWDNATSDDIETLTDDVMSADDLDWDSYWEQAPAGGNESWTVTVDTEEVDHSDLTVLNDFTTAVLAVGDEYGIDLSGFDPTTMTWTVQEGESYWVITSALLEVHYMETDGALPDDIEQQVWTWHQQLFEANKDNGVGDPDNADVIWTDTKMDVSVLFDEGPVDLSPYVPEVDPAQPEDVTLPHSDDQESTGDWPTEPFGPGLNEQNAGDPPAHSGGWEEFGLEDTDVMTTVLADPEGYNLDSEYVAAAAAALLDESRSVGENTVAFPDQDDRDFATIAMAALAQDVDASAIFVNASDANREMVENPSIIQSRVTIPTGIDDEGNPVHEGYTLGERWADLCNYVLVNADEGGWHQLVVE